jgi:RepB plasmid partitioning protein
VAGTNLSDSIWPEKEQLAEPEKPKSISGVSAEAIARIEEEMDHLQRDYRLIEDGYGTTMLNLVVAKGYVGRLLANDGVARYLERNHPEMKRELEGIIAHRCRRLRPLRAPAPLAWPCLVTD